VEDQQPVTGDLTEVRDQDEQAESAGATEAVETAQAESEGSAVEDRASRTPSKTRSLRRLGRRRRARGAAPALPVATTADDTGAIDPGPDPDPVGIEPAEDGDRAAAETAEDGDQAVAEPADDGDQAAAEPAEDGDQAVAETTEPTEKAPRARRPVGKKLVAAVLVAAALFVGSAAFAGAMVQPYLADRAQVKTKLNVARTAANAITTLWTYTPDNLEKLADRASQYLTGDFEAQYRRFVDALVAPNKQAQVTNNTLVTGAAVESLEGSDAVAIVYTNSTSTSPMTKNIPSLKYLSYRLFLKRDHARWLVTRMSTITSLDLTPRL
jgi:Mce-associated membrane protein